MKGRRVVWSAPCQVSVEEFEVPAVGRNQVLVDAVVSLVSKGT